MQHFSIRPGFPHLALVQPQRGECEPCTTDAFLAALVAHAASVSTGEASALAEKRAEPDPPDGAATAPDLPVAGDATSAAPCESMAAVVVSAPRSPAAGPGVPVATTDDARAQVAPVKQGVYVGGHLPSSSSDPAMTSTSGWARESVPPPLSSLDDGSEMATGVPQSALALPGDVAGHAKGSDAPQTAFLGPLPMISGVQRMALKDDGHPVATDFVQPNPRGTAQDPPLSMTGGPAGGHTANARPWLHDVPVVPSVSPVSPPLGAPDAPDGSAAARHGQTLAAVSDAENARLVAGGSAAQMRGGGSSAFGSDAEAADGGQDRADRSAEQPDNRMRDKVLEYFQRVEGSAMAQPPGDPDLRMIVGAKTAAPVAEAILPSGHLPADPSSNETVGADRPPTLVWDGPGHVMAGIGVLDVGTGDAASNLTFPVARDRGVLASGSLVESSRAPPPATQIAHAVLTGDSQITELLLRPDELGQVRIEMRGDDTRMTLLLSAERTETLDLLRRHADRLADELISGGIQTVDLAFGHWEGGPERGDPAEGATPDAPEAQPPMATPAASATIRPALYLRM